MLFTAELSAKPRFFFQCRTSPLLSKYSVTDLPKYTVFLNPVFILNCPPNPTHRNPDTLDQDCLLSTFDAYPFPNDCFPAACLELGCACGKA